MVSIDHNSQIINFGDYYNDPIVIFGVLTLNEGAHAHIRISSITNTSVEARIQESGECNKIKIFSLTSSLFSTPSNSFQIFQTSRSHFCAVIQTSILSSKEI